MTDTPKAAESTVPDEVIGSLAYRDDGACKSARDTIRRILHWGPLTALFIIFYTSAVAIDCTLRWWSPVTLGGFLHLLIFLTWVYLTLYNYMNAVVIGPGWLPRGWTPSTREARAFLQYCYVCKGYKAPRSHHCSACRRCVLKMDHHCPWINVCCGHKNHGYFLLFLIFAVFGCFHAFVIFIICMVKYFMETMPLQLAFAARQAKRERLRAIQYGVIADTGESFDDVIGYDADDWSTVSKTHLYFSMWQLLGILFAIGLALGVILAVGGLFIIQLRSVLRNRTGIEQYICEKASDRERIEAKRRAQRAARPESTATNDEKAEVSDKQDTSNTESAGDLRRRTEASRKLNGEAAQESSGNQHETKAKPDAEDDNEKTDKFVFPYDIGWRKNLHLVMASAMYPFSNPNYNYGVWWPLLDGCDQFTMTREQIKQKREKFVHAFIVRVVDPFHASYMRTLTTEGFRSLFGIPCCAGSLVRIDRGDVMLVTNWRKHWLFGRRLRIPELETPVEGETRSAAEIVRAVLSEREDLAATRERGWFPKRCAHQML